MTVRELKNLLERLEKMNLDYADAKVFLELPTIWMKNLNMV